VPDGQSIRRFQIAPGDGPEQMGVACIATGRDVSNALPAWLKNATDFEVLPVKEFKQIEDAYRAAEPGFFRRTAKRLPRVTR
jgi:hypothetical protein